MELIEGKIEASCAIILKTDAEDWIIRNKSLLHIIEFVVSFQAETPERLNEVFTSNIFRTLKEPIKNMVGRIRYY